jgi:hypothetical protein
MEEPTGDRTKTCPGCRRRAPAAKEVCGRCGADLLEVAVDAEVPAVRMPFRRPDGRGPATLRAVPMPPASRGMGGVRPLATRPAEDRGRRRHMWWAVSIVMLLVVGSLVALAGNRERATRPRAASEKKTRAAAKAHPSARRPTHGQRSDAGQGSRSVPKTRAAQRVTHSARLAATRSRASATPGPGHQTWASRTPAEGLAALDGRPSDAPLYQKKLSLISRRIGESEHHIATTVADAHLRGGQPCMRFLTAYETNEP